jgi:hypothetical protein
LKTDGFSSPPATFDDMQGRARDRQSGEQNHEHGERVIDVGNRRRRFAF